MKEKPQYLKDLKQSATDETASPAMPKLTFDTTRRFYLMDGSNTEILGAETNIIILGISPAENFINHRAYWSEKYGDAQAGAPICASPDGKQPFDFIPEPQALSCNKCPQAVSGSGGYGQSHACKSFKHIYCLIAKGFLNFNCTTIVRFKVPVTALKQLGTYRWELKQEGIPIAAVITRVTFDPEAKGQRPMFAFNGFVPEAVVKITTDIAISDGIQKLLTGQQAPVAIEYEATEPANPPSAPPVVPPTPPSAPPVVPPTPPSAPPVVVHQVSVMTSAALSTEGQALYYRIEQLRKLDNGNLQMCQELAKDIREAFIDIKESEYLTKVLRTKWASLKNQAATLVAPQATEAIFPMAPQQTPMAPQQAQAQVQAPAKRVRRTKEQMNAARVVHQQAPLVPQADAVLSDLFSELEEIGNTSEEAPF